jgi:glycosyltransferase involved in cell wall biosynthesis
LISGIYPPDIGGPAKFISEYSKWLQSQAIPVQIITLNDLSDQNKLDERFAFTSHSRSRSIILRFILSIKAIYRSMKVGDYVLANGLFIETYIASLLSNKTYVTKVPGDFVWERARNSGFTQKSVQEFQNIKLPIKYKILRSMFTASLNKSTAVIVTSNYLANFCINWGIPKGKIHLIRNAVSSNKFPFNIDKKKDIDVLCVSRLMVLKGINEVIKVCSELSLKLVIAGSGPELNNLRLLATELACDVTFLGDVEQEELPDLYSRSRFFVLNSQFESTSHALVEARLVGVFCISNLGTGSDEIIKHLYDGLLCGDANNLSLKEALIYGIKNPDFVNLAIHRAYQTTKEEFDTEKIYNQILSLVKES